MPTKISEQPRPFILPPRTPAPHRKPAVGEAMLEHGAWVPPKWELADAAAMRALYNGTAGAEDQRRAMRWILEAGAALYDMSYRPGGEAGRRDTDFAEGRRFVGNQILKLVKVDTGKMRRDEPRADRAEPKS